MKPIAAIASLLCMTAVAAQAQVVGPPPAAAPAPAPCALVVESGAQYAETPLFGFDPAVSSTPLPVPPAQPKPVLVRCTRSTIIPEVSDYRVLAEMHLPLAIAAGGRTLFLGSAEGRFQVGVQDGAVTPEEKTALQDRMDQMQTAMDARSAARK
jgi:hypothetical protein